MIKTIKIGAICYTVKEVDDLHSVDADGRKTGLHGQINWGHAQIEIDPDQTDDVKITTLWHEAVHGLLNNAGHNNHNEAWVQALGYGLVQVIRDNPALIEMTLRGLGEVEGAE